MGMSFVLCFISCIKLFQSQYINIEIYSNIVKSFFDQHFILRLLQKLLKKCSHSLFYFRHYQLNTTSGQEWIQQKQGSIMETSPNRQYYADGWTFISFKYLLK